MNNRFKSLYLDIAKRTAKMSRAVRLQVGCVVVKDDRIISMSWNGTPTGWDNNCEDKAYMDDMDAIFHENKPEQIKKQWPFEDEQGRYSLTTKPEVLHAESNSLSKLARSSESGNGAAMFITHAPCIECAKLIYQSGITSVCYISAYRDARGVEFLKKCGVDVEQVDLTPDLKQIVAEHFDHE